jgi:hypothetical protein
MGTKMNNVNYSISASATKALPISVYNAEGIVANPLFVRLVKRYEAQLDRLDTPLKPH